MYPRRRSNQGITSVTKIKPIRISLNPLAKEEIPEFFIAQKSQISPLHDKENKLSYKMSLQGSLTRVSGFSLCVEKTRRKSRQAPCSNSSQRCKEWIDPLVIKVTATAPPSGKEPSVVISGKSRIRNVIKIPNPKMAQIKPLKQLN